MFAYFTKINSKSYTKNGNAECYCSIDISYCFCNTVSEVINLENNIFITRARHAWPEPGGFAINRPYGLKEYTFLRFHGSVKLLVNGELVTTTPGSCIFYGVDTPQWFQSPEPLTHDWMHMTGDVGKSLEMAGLQLNTLYSLGNSQFVTAILREIEFELLSNPGENTPLVQLKYQELLIKLARAVGRELPEGEIKPTVKTQMRQVRSHIFARLDQNWTVQEMAELAFISASRFHTVYRTVFGISPMDDLIHARIDMAKNRLCNSDETVANLAMELGYRNVTHFCRQFKKITGLTPLEFRKKQYGQR